MHDAFDFDRYLCEARNNNLLQQSGNEPVPGPSGSSIPRHQHYAESREAQSLLKRSVELGNSPLSTKKYEANQSQRLRRQSSHPMNGDGSRTCYQQAMRLVKEDEDFLMESYFEIGDF
ncbi:uncharacterized protein CLUP02_18386 [Colletotrichum lupini]|uniref:Uncharacterized protein n=1 Tax=Colletotrichum lupini TaxID=145971 RepID=A0A9Q8SH91_9PEZI|nr:uncharacterized protein CLUP02_18386 [Colletotrichum lupini]UQC76871.1 hypothetical protein CLUP02_18386 [Colletotrichum lupini]